MNTGVMGFVCHMMALQEKFSAEGYGVYGKILRKSSDSGPAGIEPAGLWFGPEFSPGKDRGGPPPSRPRNPTGISDHGAPDRRPPACPRTRPAWPPRSTGSAGP